MQCNISSRLQRALPVIIIIYQSHLNYGLNVLHNLDDIAGLKKFSKLIFLFQKLLTMWLLYKNLMKCNLCDMQCNCTDAQNSYVYIVLLLKCSAIVWLLRSVLVQVCSQLCGDIWQLNIVALTAFGVTLLGCGSMWQVFEYLLQSTYVYLVVHYHIWSMYI